MQQGGDSEYGGSGDGDSLRAEAVHPLSGEWADYESDDAEGADDYSELPVRAAALDDVEGDEGEHGGVGGEDTV